MFFSEYFCIHEVPIYLSCILVENWNNWKFNLSQVKYWLIIINWLHIRDASGWWRYIMFINMIDGERGCAFNTCKRWSVIDCSTMVLNAEISVSALIIFNSRGFMYRHHYWNRLSRISWLLKNRAHSNIIIFKASGNTRAQTRFVDNHWPDIIRPNVIRH